MRQNQIGNTGLQVTEFGFGAASLGNLYRVVNDGTATEAVNTGWARGIRYFDTAPHYGLGLSERRLGAALGTYPRSEYLLSTKVGRLLEPNPEPSGSDLPSGGFAVPDTLRRRFDFSADGVRRSLDSSLERLGVDYVDLVLVHDPDSHVDQAVREAIPALIRLREQGVVRAIGVAMNQWQAPLRIVEETTIDAVMLAGRWTLLDRTGQPLLDACAERGVSVLAAAPYNSGLLSQPRPPKDAYFDYGPATADVRARANELADTCERHGVALPDAALQFPLRHPAVSAVVVGTRTAEQVESTIARLGIPVSEQCWRELEA